MLTREPWHLSHTRFMHKSLDMRLEICIGKWFCLWFLDISQGPMSFFFFFLIQMNHNTNVQIRWWGGVMGFRVISFSQLKKTPKKHLSMLYTPRWDVQLYNRDWRTGVHHTRTPHTYTTHTRRCLQTGDPKILLHISSMHFNRYANWNEKWFRYEMCCSNK